MIENINIILDERGKLYQLDIDRGSFNKVGNSTNLIDDWLYNWFLCDIAIAFFHAISYRHVNEPQKCVNFVWDFIEPFLKGYLKENRIDSYWIEKLPLFLDYRRICSYIFFTKIWVRKI